MGGKRISKKDLENELLIKNNPKLISEDNLKFTYLGDYRFSSMLAILPGKTVENFDDYFNWHREFSYANRFKSNLNNLIRGVFEEYNNRPPFLFILPGVAKEVYSNYDFKALPQYSPEESLVSKTPQTLDGWAWRQIGNNKSFYLSLSFGVFFDKTIKSPNIEERSFNNLAHKYLGNLFNSDSEDIDFDLFENIYLDNLE